MRRDVHAAAHYAGEIVNAFIEDIVSKSCQELFLCSGEFVPFFTKLFFEVINFLCGLILLLYERCPRSGIVGVRKIKVREERASA